MQELLSILIIGIALSMDTFSLSLSVGTLKITNKKAVFLASIVGCMHFFMPFLGMLLGNKLSIIFKINYDILLGLILILIAIEIIIDIIRHEEEKLNLSTWGMILFSLGVSLDSFSVGIGIKAITKNFFLAMSTFSLCSFIFTYIGLNIGRLGSKILGIYANIIGAIILFVLGIIHLI